MQANGEEATDTVKFHEYGQATTTAKHLFHFSC